MTDTERAALKAAAEKGAAAEKATPIGYMYNASYMAKVNPAAVLALLAENERMRNCLEQLNTIGGLGHNIHRRIDAALSEPSA